MRKQMPGLVALVLILFLGLPFVVSEVFADCPGTYLYSYGASDINAPAPIARYRYERAVYLITEAEMWGGPGPTLTFTGIGWRYATGPGGAGGTAPLKVYLQNTSDTTNAKSATWATAISGMTLVHDASTTLPTLSGSFDIAFSGGAFTYTGGGVYVAFDWGPYTGTLSSGSVSTNTDLTGGILSALSNTTAPTALSAGDNRPETRFSTPVPGTDVYVVNVASMGAVPLGLVGAQNIRAIVYQGGDLDLTDVPVTLNITGVDTSTETKTVPSLARCGGVASVAFAPFTPTLTGTDTLTASVPPNPVPNGGETLSTPLDVTLNRYSYEHAGEPAYSEVGGYTPLEVVARFNTTSATQVDAVTVNFAEATGNHYRLAIRGDDGTGKPGALLYLDAADRVDAAGDTTIRLPSPVAVGAGNFFAGIRAMDDTVWLGTNYEYIGRSGTFFFTFTPNTGGWYDFANSNVAQNKLNIGVTLGNCLAPLAVAVTPGGTTNAACNAPIVFTATPTAGTGPFTYQWTENGSDIPGATASTYSAIHAGGSFAYNCKVTDSGGCSNVQAAAASTGAWGPTATVGGGASICAGGSTNIQAALTGTGPWSLTWSDGFVQNGVIASPATRTVSPAITTTYTVTAISDASCAGTSGGSALVTVNPVPQETAAGSGSGNILEWSGKEGLLWPTNPDASSYTLYRGQRADLPQLLTSAVDSCTRYQGAATSLSDLSEVPPIGGFFWYLVTGSSASGCEGSAGDGRVVNSSGPCS